MKEKYLKTYSGAGEIFLREVNDKGIPLPGAQWISPGNAYPFTMQVPIELIKSRSRRPRDLGQVIAVKARIGDEGVNGSFSIREMSARTLAMHLAGIVEVEATAAGTLADAPFTLGEPGEWTSLGHTNISDLQVKTMKGEEMAVVDSTHYMVNQQLGLISPVAGGDLEAGGVAITVSGSYPAVSAERVSIGTNKTQRFAVKIALLNEFDQQELAINLDMVSLASNSAGNYISEENSEGEAYEFTFTAETIEGRSTPGYISGLTMVQATVESIESGDEEEYII